MLVDVMSKRPHLLPSEAACAVRPVAIVDTIDATDRLLLPEPSGLSASEMGQMHDLSDDV